MKDSTLTFTGFLRLTLFATDKKVAIPIPRVIGIFDREGYTDIYTEGNDTAISVKETIDEIFS